VDVGIGVRGEVEEGVVDSEHAGRGSAGEQHKVGLVLDVGQVDGVSSREASRDGRRRRRRQLANQHDVVGDGLDRIQHKVVAVTLGTIIQGVVDKERVQGALQ
jgi:hypothetical protein